MTSNPQETNTLPVGVLGPERLAWLRYLRFGRQYWPDSTRAQFASNARYVENKGLTRYLPDGTYELTDAGRAALSLLTPDENQ